MTAVSALALTFPPEIVEAIAQRAAEIVLERQCGIPHSDGRHSPHATVAEAALHLGCGYKACPKCSGSGKVQDPETHEEKTCSRCRGEGRVVNRQRVDDLLSQGLLHRHKDGGRTLIAWDELDAYLAGAPTGPTGATLSGVAHALPQAYRDGYASAIRG